MTKKEKQEVKVAIEEIAEQEYSDGFSFGLRAKESEMQKKLNKAKEIIKSYLMYERGEGIVERKRQLNDIAKKFLEEA